MSNDFNSNGSTPQFLANSTLKGIDGHKVGSGYRQAAQEAAQSEVFNDDAPKPDQHFQNVTQYETSTMRVSTSRPIEAGYDVPAFTSEAGGFEVTDHSKVTPHTRVRIGSKIETTVAAAMHMGLLHKGANGYEFTDRAIEQIEGELERGQGPKVSARVQFANQGDAELVDALDFAMKGNFKGMLAQAVSRHAAGEEPFTHDMLQQVQKAVPGANPAKVQEAMTQHITNSVESAVRFVADQSGFKPAHVYSKLASLSVRARAAFLRGVVFGAPREVLSIWDAVRNGNLR